MSIYNFANNFSTPRDLLRYAVTRFNGAKLFFGHGSAEAFDEAAYLVLHTLKLPLHKLDPFLDARLLPEEVLQVLAVIERRVSERVPAAYITNEAWLGTYSFYVDERVLVPRSFIAELIPHAFSPWCRTRMRSKTCSNCAPVPAAWRSCWPICSRMPSWMPWIFRRMRWPWPNAISATTSWKAA